jgi:hypothetical protein
MAQGFGRVSASSMDPSRKIEFLILARRGSWTYQVPWRLFQVSSEMTSLRLSPPAHAMKLPNQR